MSDIGDMLTHGADALHIDFSAPESPAGASMTLLLAHPDAEDLGRFVEGTLDDPERAAIVEHIADCDDCRILVVDAAEFVEPAKTESRASGGWESRRRVADCCWRRIVLVRVAQSAGPVIEDIIEAHATTDRSAPQLDFRSSA